MIKILLTQGVIYSKKFKLNKKHMTMSNMIISASE